MAFVDEYTFFAAAGRGGDGVVRWRREKFLPKGGPNGGNGGKGGDVYIVGVRDIMRLSRIIHKDSYRAAAGEPGASSSMTGANGRDLTIELPTGSIVTNRDTGVQVELLREGEPIRILMGGAGGFGNEHFKSSTNQAPMECTKGKEGEQGNFEVELRLIADVGLVGLPNAGKTSLLNALTNAGAKVGDYPFTTLDPNLGAYHGYILADIPGLIEGASEGKGLGHKFLRHISRTSLILHCISLERDSMIDDYLTVRRELDSNGLVGTIAEYIVFTKYDMTDEDTISGKIHDFSTAVRTSILGTVTVLDDDSVRDIAQRLTQVLKEQAR